ncbi:MAG TPA: ImmA/IrrE family metallo-endopeptidase [Flavobacterium sp.]|jgi:Zn-dependent peptidase ImmA (M78 family)
MVNFNERILEVRANKFRREKGIGEDNAIDFEKLLMSLDVLSYFRPLNDDFSGMALKTKNSCFMLVNTKHSVGRQHFTVGHELYHLYIQENFSFRRCQTGKFDKKDREEYNADVFSSYLLMPESGIMKQIPEEELAWGSEISFATIIKLEQYFGVSRRALLIRLEKLRLLRTDPAKYLVNIKKSAAEFGYSTALYDSTEDQQPFVVGNYGIKVKELFDKDKISESHYHSLMYDIGIDVEDPNIVDDGKEI